MQFKKIKFSKFTFHIKIYKEFEMFLSKLVWKETLFLLNIRVSKKMNITIYVVFFL